MQEIRIAYIEDPKNVPDKKRAPGWPAPTSPISAADVPENDGTPPVGLEEALELTGFGGFSRKLLGGVWLSMAVMNFTSTDVAYALPAAQCDLQLTPMEKGWINAALYVGMLTTAFVWGALSDRLGRKYPLMLAYFGMTACSFVNAVFVDSAWAFLLCRVVMGSLFIAAASLALTYAGELFGKRYRAKIFMWAGTMQGLSAAAHAGVAMWVIPMELDFMRSWRVFLLITCLVNLSAGAYLLLLPESPKYLAVRGRQREAIGVLASIFASNTGLPANCYPVKSLTVSKNLQPQDSGNPFVVIARQFVKLCRKPYRTPLIFALLVQPSILFCQNTMRMWVPTIFAGMEMDLAHGLAESRNVCGILTGPPTLAPTASPTANQTAPCDSHINASVYLNSIVIMLTRAGLQLAAGFIIRPIGDTVLLVLAMSLASAFVFAWPWSSSATVVLACAACFEGLANVAFSTIMNITVELFPTNIRSSAVSLANFAGRLGSVVGNLAFPLLLTIDCSLAFWTGAGLLAFGAFISMFKPKPSFTPTPSTGLAKRLSEEKSRSSRESIEMDGHFVQ